MNKKQATKLPLGSDLTVWSDREDLMTLKIETVDWMLSTIKRLQGEVEQLKEKEKQLSSLQRKEDRIVKILLED